MTMASSLLSEVMSYDDPREMARHLCGRIRTAVNAKTVLFLRHEECSKERCEPLYVSSEEPRHYFWEDPKAKLCPFCDPEELPLYTADMPAGDPLGEALRGDGIETIMRFPLHTADRLVGTFCILDLDQPDQTDQAAETAEIFRLIGPAIALTIQNASVRLELQRQAAELEAQVAERTAELETVNRELSDSRLAALNMMEDAILSQRSMAFQNELFQSFMDSLPANVFFKDTKGRLQSVNKSLMELLQKDAAAIIGKTDAELFSAEEAERIRQDDLRVMESGEMIELEELLGGHWWRTIKVPRYDESGRLCGIYGISWDITDRKEAMDQLKLTQFAVDHSIAEILLINKDFGFEYVNAAVCRALGYSQEELLELTISDISPDLADGKTAQEYWEMLRTQKSVRKELLHRRKDGSVYPVESQVSYLNHNGQEYAFTHAQNITDRKEAEAQLKLTQFAIDHANGEILLLNDDLGFEYVNPAVCKALGYTREELLQLRVPDINLDFGEEQCSQIKKMCRENKSLLLESRRLCKDGSVYPVESQLNYMNNNGRGYAFVYSQNITERKEAEKQLKLSRFAMDHSSLAVYLAGADGRFHYVNQAAVDQLGYSSEELLGLSVTDIESRHVQSDADWKAVWNLLKEKKHAQVKGVHRRKDGRCFPVEVTMNFLAWDDEEYLIGFATDISERVAAEADLKQSREQYSTLLSNLPGMAYLCADDQHWTMRFISDGCTEITEYQPADLIQNKTCAFSSLVHPDDRAAIANRVRKSLAEQRHFELEYRILTRSGREKWVWERGIGRIDDEGNVLIEGFISDITKRRENEQRIIDLARFPQENTSPVVRISAAGNLLYANQASHGMLEESDRRIGELVSDKWRSLTGQVLQAGEPSEWNMSLYGRIYAVTFVPIPDRGYVNLYANDITEQQKARDALRKSEVHLRTMLDSIGDAVISTDINGLVTNMNPVAQQLIGCRLEEALRQPITRVFRIVHEHTREPLPNPVKLVLATGRPAELAQNALLIARSGREIPVADSAAPILSAAKKVAGVVMVFRDQTFERESRRSLEENEARFRHLLEQMELIPVQGYNEKRQVIYWNAASTKAYGYSPEEALGRRIEELIIPKGMRQRVIRQINGWFAGGDPIPTEENMMQDKNGGLVPVHSSHVMHVTTAGIKEMFCIDVDLRNLKAAENQMRESRNLLRSIIDTIPAEVWWKDADLHYMGANEPFASWVRLNEPEDVIGKTDDDLYPGPYARSFAEDDRAVLETGRPKLHMVKPVDLGCKDIHWREVNKVPLRGQDGRVIGLVGTAVDITERKKNEDELKQLSTAIEQSPEAIVITDVSGAIQYVNPAFERVSGYSREEVLGKNPRILNGGRNDAALYRELWETITDGRVWEGSLENRRKDGTLFTQEISIAPVKNESGRIINYVAIKRDITQELLREEELRQSQKMEAVGLLAGGVAHDFNNILQAVQGFCELLLFDLEEGTLSHQNVLEIKKSSTKAIGLTKQLLTLSRKSPTDCAVLEMNDMVWETEPLIRILLGEQYELEMNLADGLPEITADPGQMTQIIMNLAVNARDAMAGGGRLTIETREIAFERPDPSMPESRPGTFVCLSLSDTGHGIEEHVLKRLFEPFFTTKELGKGTGLGLSVVYGIVQQSRGWITVRSELGKGSTFHLFFPAAAEADNGAAPEPDEEPEPPRVLVVDDEEAIRTLMKDILQQSGFCVTTAASQAEAVEIFSNSDGDYDLLLVDMKLPDGSGLETADRLREAVPDLPVLLCSGYAEEEVRWKTSTTKEYAFLSKPFTITALVTSVNDLLVGKNRGKQ